MLLKCKESLIIRISRMKCDKMVSRMLPSQEQFHCLACSNPGTFHDNFSSLEQHFHCKHGVPDLLGCPATLAVVLPHTLASYYCMLCGEGSWLEDQVMDHLETRHGAFFLEDWQKYCESCCR